MTGTDERATLLLVEDDTHVRAIIERHLADLGYRLLAAEDARQALELVATEDRLDALIADIVLPGVNGVALSARLRERWPSLPVLFISGWQTERSMEHGYSKELGPLLAKPFTLDELGVAVTDILSHDAP